MFSTSTGERSRSSSRSRRRVSITGVTVFAVALGLTLPSAFAVAAPFHELEGNIMDDSVGDPPIDWSDVFTVGTTTTEPAPVATPPAGILDPDFTRDFRTSAAGAYVNGDLTYFATGSKDTLDITPGWQCKKTNNATDKGDWVNAYGYAARVDHDNSAGTPDHTLFFFGLEKDDDNGTNNVGIWLLQSEEVGCESTGGGNVAFTGSHVDDDLLAVVEYDSGGNIGTAQGYVWDNGLPNSPTFDEADAKCDPNATTFTQKFCVTTNGAGSITSPWWSPQKDDKSVSAELQTNVFVEGYLDVTDIFEGNEPCFATSIANSRASTSTTAALYDFVEIEAATCGPLTLKKYFDRDANGTMEAGEPFLAGWEFKVFADGADPDVDDPILVGYTGATGSVSFADVPTGNYDVYETGMVKVGAADPVAATEYWASDPVGTYPVKYDLVQTTAGATVDFGNACFVDKSFSVTGVPAGAALALTYAINDPDDNGPSTTVNMSVDGTTSTTRTYTLANTLKPGDTIDWSYAYQTGGPAGSISVEDDETMAGFTDTSGVGTACAKPNTTAFPLTDLTGSKFKDVDADGTKDAEDTTGLAGFEFKLYAGSGGAVGTALGTSTSVAGGGYGFDDVTPGAYSVVETPEAGWQQTAPSAPAWHTVTVGLGDASKVIGDFLNAPLTDISVTVDPQTTSTFADSIQCRKGAAAVGTDVDGTPADGGVTKMVNGTNLLVGTYTCTIVITDP